MAWSRGPEPDNAPLFGEKTMRPALTATVAAIASCATLSASAAQTPPDLKEVAFVANAEAGTVALVEVTSRSIIGVIDINPARAERKGPGATNYAQDTDVSPDGRTIYVSRGYLGDVAAFDIASAKMLWQRSLNTGRADHMTLTKTAGACSSRRSWTTASTSFPLRPGRSTVTW